MASFNKDNFIDCGDYYLCKYPQGTKEWLASRPEVTASVIAYYVGLDKKPDFQQSKEEQEENFRKGHIGEEIIKEWFVKKYGKKIKDLSLVVPKWDTNIGASVDGISDLEEVGEDGKEEEKFIIECKTTKRLKSLLKGSKEERKGKEPKEYLRKAHYYQMLMGMKLLNVKLCYYLVFAYEDKKFFKVGVKFNQEDWQHLYDLYKKKSNNQGLCKD